MPRPSSKDRLIDVGVDLMHRVGYQAASSQTVAEAAGVPKGSFFNHFGSKDDFAELVVRRYVAGGEAMLAALAADTTLSPAQKLQTFLGWNIAEMLENRPGHGCLLGNLAIESAQTGPAVRAAVADGFLRWRAQLAAIIAAGRTDGSLAGQIEPEALADLILNSCQGALLRMKVDPDPRHIEAIGKALNALLALA